MAEEVFVVRVDDQPLRKVRRKRLKSKQREYIWVQSNQRCYICKEPLEKNGQWHVEVQRVISVIVT